MVFKVEAGNVGKVSLMQGPVTVFSYPIWQTWGRSFELHTERGNIELEVPWALRP